jgi:hypothetical protein
LSHDRPTQDANRAGFVPARSRPAQIQDKRSPHMSIDKNLVRVGIGIVAALILINSLHNFLPNTPAAAAPQPPTAEQAFAANFPHGTYISGGVDVSEHFTGIDVAVLSPAELEKYQAMRNAGRLNDLMLFFGRCTHSDYLGTPVFENPFKRWQALPDQLRSEAGDREVAEINAINGWSDFCAAMPTQIRAQFFYDLLSK